MHKKKEKDKEKKEKKTAHCAKLNKICISILNYKYVSRGVLKWFGIQGITVNFNV